MSERAAQNQFLDPRWRLSNLYTITDKAGRQVPFRPNEAQLLSWTSCTRPTSS